MALLAINFVFVAVLLAGAPCGSRAREVISDIADVLYPPPSLQRAALGEQAHAFWGEVRQAAEAMKLPAHLEAFAATERALAELPAENDYVRVALQDALERCKRADGVILRQAFESARVASGHVSGSAQLEADFSSFLRDGGDFLGRALGLFTESNDYQQRSRSQLAGRQADVLPLLRETANSAGNVLTDVRLASKRSFDVLKYDIYNDGVPKTPEAAKDAAHLLVDAAADTRRAFTSFITRAAGAIQADVEAQSAHPSALAVQGSLGRASVVGNAAEDATSAGM